MKELSFFIIFLGPPGSGKGTYAVKLCKDLKIPHISTGEIFRAHLHNKTPFGQKIKSFMDSGKLVPDELVIDILIDRVSQLDCKNGYILDGFPRTLVQADEFHSKIKAKRQIVLNFELPDDTIVKRLSSRRACEKCMAPYNILTNMPKKEGFCNSCNGKLFQRDDDREEIIKKRLEVYHKQTKPLIEYYKKQKILHVIDNTKHIEDVYKIIIKLIDKLLPGQS